MGGSLITTVFVLLMFGGGGAYYYFVVWKKMMSPEARAKAFAAAGYHPGETVAASFGGLLVNRDASCGFMGSIMALHRDAASGTHVFSNITSADRLHLTIGIGASAQNVMFEAHARPAIRVLGRVWMQDTTGVGDMLMDRTKTMLCWVDEGNAPPPNMVRRTIYNQVGREEATCIIEVAGPAQPPLYFETYDAGVHALQQWASRGGAPGQMQQQPYPQQQQYPQQPGYGAPPPPPGGYRPG